MERSDGWRNKRINDLKIHRDVVNEKLRNVDRSENQEVGGLD